MEQDVVRRSEVVITRVNVFEKGVLVKLAGIDGRNTSETLRELIRQEAHRRGLWPVHINPRGAEQ